MSEPKEVWENVHRERVYWNSSWTADEFRALIASVEEQAPEGAQVMVAVEVESGCYDSSDEVTLEIGFNRTETAEEVAARDERERQRLNHQRQHDLQMLARLQAQYGTEKDSR
jgi:hypothetical protein